jgi:hypothetical protein
MKTQRIVQFVLSATSRPFFLAFSVEMWTWNEQQESSRSESLRRFLIDSKRKREPKTTSWVL